MPTILLATRLVACGKPKPTTQTSATIQWSDSTAKEVHAQVEKTMGAFASMNLDGFKAGLTEDVVAFEMDLEGKPVRLGPSPAPATAREIEMPGA